MGCLEYITKNVALLMYRCLFAFLQETALNIAYSCQLISFDQELICLSARNKVSGFYQRIQ